MKDDEKIIKFMEEKIKDNLFTKTSDKFVVNLMREVNIEYNFSKENLKTEKLAKTILWGMGIFIVSCYSIFILYFLNDLNADLFINNYYNNFTNFLEKNSNKFFSITDFSNKFIFVLFAIIVFTIYYHVDKLIYKKK